MYEFYLQGMICIQLMNEMGEKPKSKMKTKEKPIWLLSHPPFVKWRPTVFQSPMGLKTIQTFFNGGKELD